MAFDPGHIAERLGTAVWVFDIERERMVWANAAALKLWGADRLETLTARDFSSEMTAAVRTRLANYLAGFHAGHEIRESWTFYPHGHPVSVDCRCSGYRLDDGRMAMLVEGIRDEKTADTHTLRHLEALRHTPVMISLYDTTGHMLTANPAAESAFGRTRELAARIHDHREWARIEATLWHEGRCLTDAWTDSHQGARLHQLDLRVSSDPNSGERMIVVSEIDVTPRQQALQALAESERRLLEITDVLADGVCVIDERARVTFINPAAAQMLNTTPRAALGRSVDTLFRQAAVGQPPGNPATQAMRQRARHRQSDIPLHADDGGRRVVSAIATPMLRGERVIGAVTALHDISELRNTEAALRRSRERLAKAQRVARLGSWEWQPATGTMTWSRQLRHIFALSHVDVPAMSILLERVHPADRQAVDQALHGVEQAPDIFDTEFRVCHPDGLVHTVSMRGESVHSDRGDMLVTGTVLDITEHKAAEMAAKTAERRLAALIENLGGGILVEDERRRVVLANRTFCDLFGIPAAPESLIGVDCTDTATQVKALFRDPERFVTGIETCLSRQQPVRGEELETVDGRVLERTYTPVFLEGEHRGHLWQYWDITGRKRAEAALRALASTDPLTGLPNRRELLAQSAREVARARRGDAALSLLLIDIDHFKAVNDHYGHAVGDHALQAIAALLESECRAGDLASRIGGEEFVLLLPDADINAATTIAERLRDCILHSPVAAGGEALRLTVSIGVTTFAPGDRDFETMLARADTAMYAAKSAGRNRVESVAA
ncbi:diguanylate cyclase [Arhodomonas sp. AD133]|uniref:diguanylate cyclase n=1 Tax=Arhodomonas sp. AD133 TaxID=3415009 RepID=UPI003EBC4A74